MPLSQKTAGEFWREAVEDLGDIPVSAPHFSKYLLINRAQEMVQGMFADLVGEAYMRESTPVLSTDGKYYSSGASWDADTNYLTATMSTSWASTDVGNIVIFRDSSSVYVGWVYEWISTTVVKLSGDNLPTADIATVNDVLMAGNTITNGQIDISTLRMLRYGTQLNINLKSTVTNSFETLSRASFNAWNTTAPQNRNKIVWTLVGTSLYLKKGSSLSSYGVLVIEYPSLPEEVSLDTDKIDLLDGTMMQIGIATLRAMVQRRLSLPISEADKEATQKLIYQLYTSFNQDINKELVEQKLESLL